MHAAIVDGLDAPMWFGQVRRCWWWELVYSCYFMVPRPWVRLLGLTETSKLKAQKKAGNVKDPRAIKILEGCQFISR